MNYIDRLTFYKKFISIESLRAWCKDNIKNKAVIAAVLAPIKEMPPKPKKDIVHNMIVAHTKFKRKGLYPDV